MRLIKGSLVGQVLAGILAIAPSAAFAALLVAGLCGCASAEVQKSVAEKEREARYSNYVDSIDQEWSEHL